jgi:hypothetical protein
MQMAGSIGLLASYHSSAISAPVNTRVSPQAFSASYLGRRAAGPKAAR